MRIPWWSDKESLFVAWPLGFTINFKFIAKKLGFVRTESARERPTETEEAPTQGKRTAEDRLRDAIERSRFEDT